MRRLSKLRKPRKISFSKTLVSPRDSHFWGILPQESIGGKSLLRHGIEYPQCFPVVLMLFDIALMGRVKRIHIERFA